MNINTRYNCGTYSSLIKITKSKEVEVNKETLLQTFVTNTATANKDNDCFCQQLIQRVHPKIKWLNGELDPNLWIAGPLLF